MSLRSDDRKRDAGKAGPGSDIYDRSGERLAQQRLDPQRIIDVPLAQAVEIPGRYEVEP